MSSTVTRPSPTLASASGPARRPRFRSPYWLSVAVAPVLYLVWYLSAQAELVAPILLPAPADVWDAVPRVYGANGFLEHVSRTVGEIVLGLALGAAIGFLLGVLLGSSTRLRAAYLPLLSAAESVPTVILAPLIIAWFGFGLDGKVVQAAIACFYAVFITTLSGLAMAEADSISLMRSLRASRWQILRKVKIPFALPVIFGGLQMGATTAIIGAIVSEFVGADRGLGFLMLRYRSSYDTPAVWVLIFVFLAFGLIAYLIIWAAERRIVFWRRPESTHDRNDNP
ncbi:ABC transporter permease [Nocardioides sp. LHG3406-4]|uniref:ABC transporter permease n=1 Tax=Nocardioides sp. LHG3406-4 TaxID=2804575 RepID=UPI003CF270A2